MDEKNRKWIVFALVIMGFIPIVTATTSTAEEPNTALLDETFGGSGNSYNLSEHWGTEWISSDKPNYTHFRTATDSQNALNTMLRVTYGSPPHGGILTFLNGSYQSGNFVPYTYDYPYLRESTDIFRPDSYADNFAIYYMYSSNTQFEILKPQDSTDILIYYDDTSGNLVSINTHIAIGTGKWYRVQVDFYKNSTTASVSIIDKSTDTSVYAHSFFDVKIEKNIWRIDFSDYSSDDGHYIYIDNAQVSTYENVPSSPAPSPIPSNPMKYMSGSPILLVTFIALIAMIFGAFIYDHWATVIIIGVSAFLLFAVFLNPFFGITSKIESMIVASGLAFILAGIKYYTIRDKFQSLFGGRNYSTLLIVGGIIVMIVLLFFS